jgi:hypothetical protein
MEGSGTARRGRKAPGREDHSSERRERHPLIEGAHALDPNMREEQPLAVVM